MLGFSWEAHLSFLLQTIGLRPHRTSLLQTGVWGGRNKHISSDLNGQYWVQTCLFQIKRRPSEALPELLLPVAPMSGSGTSQPQDSPSGLASLESGLSHLEVDDWDF